MTCEFLVDLLLCPECRGELNTSPDVIECAGGGRNYPQPSDRWVDLVSDAGDPREQAGE
ncbi:MAG: hypothetical protein ABI836_07160 [Gemmatimonadota bacterium]